MKNRSLLRFNLFIASIALALVPSTKSYSFYEWKQEENEKNAMQDDIHSSLLFGDVYYGNGRVSTSKIINQTTVRSKTQNRDYNRALTKSEKKDLRYIINTLSRESLVKIGTENSSLTKAGERINNIHPLRFLLTVFSDEELKAGVHGIRNRAVPWIWDKFLKGLTDSLKLEASRKNMLTAYVEDLSRNLELSPSLLYPIVDSEKWNELVETLIEIVPRKTDPNRYNM